MSVESFLDLGREEISRRIKEEERRIPTTKRTEYLKLRLRRFETPEWGLINYLLRNNQALFRQACDQYSDYDGNETTAAIVEDLKGYYILRKLLLRYQRKSTKKR